MKYFLAFIITLASFQMASASFGATEFVCSFDANETRVDTQKETEEKAISPSHSKIAYEVKIDEVNLEHSPEGVTKDDGLEHRMATVFKGYIDLNGKFRVANIQTHEVVKSVKGFGRGSITEYKGEFFQLEIQNSMDLQSRVFFEGVGSNEGTLGKCL